MASFFRALHLSFYISSARLVTYFVFLTYILQGNALTADRTFFVLTIFNTIRQVMLSYWPTAAAAVGELFVSMGRIEVKTGKICNTRKAICCGSSTTYKTCLQMLKDQYAIADHNGFLSVDFEHLY